MEATYSCGRPLPTGEQRLSTTPRERQRDKNQPAKYSLALGCIERPAAGGPATHTEV